jgi:hypothetical protein
MSSRLLLLPLLLALFTVSALAQSAGTITGRVVTPDGSPVPGAAVEVLGTAPKLGSYARTDGSYRIRAVRSGSYKLRITARGFVVDTVSVVVDAAKELSLGITVKPMPADVRSAGDRRVWTKDGSVAVRGVSPMALESSEGAATSDALLASAPPPTAEFGAVGGGAGGSGGGALMAVESAPMFSGTDISVTSPRGSVLSKRAATATTTATPTEATVVPEREAPPEPVEPQRPGQLTAGEWCDLVNWPYWLDVAKSEEFGKFPSYWGFDPSSRISVIAIDGERLVADAEVTLTDGQSGTLWRARTDNRGRAELFVGVAGTRAGTYRVEVRSGSAKAFVNNVAAGASGPVIAKLRDAAPAPTTLDVMFVIDATGSMGDEITYIKSELESVIDRVRENHSDRVAIRLAANFYRDQGDEYVVRAFPFTESTFEAIGFIRDNEAGGGGDFPEAVEEALEDGIEKHDWSPSARARLMFMVLDAPPHYDEARIRQIQNLAKRAAEKGIRIIPVASSGIDKETEFLLRLLGIYSGGTYTFLTDDSGIGNSHLKPSIGKYDIEYLDDLMVRLIGRWVEEVTIDEELRAALR